jgi:hypothetical protein
MRVAIGIVIVVGLGIWALMEQPSPYELFPLPLAERQGGGRASASRLEGHREADRVSPFRLGESQGRTSTPQVAAIPAPIEPTPSLPPTLELVSLPTIPGTKAAAPKTISRAQAVASVIGSREFQETVNPLARLYLAAFGRYPDYEGLNYYTGQREEARPLHEIATEFTRSREFEARYGELDNAQFVELIFTNVLGNPSQADVRNYWVNEIDAGRMTRGQVLVDLAESGAFRERSAAQVFVSTAYTEILRRTPDPNGYNYWVAQLQAGQPPSRVIDGLLNGP